MPGSVVWQCAIVFAAVCCYTTANATTTTPPPPSPLSVCTGHKLAYKNMACCGSSNVTATCVAPGVATTIPTTTITDNRVYNVSLMCDAMLHGGRMHHYNAVLVDNAHQVLEHVVSYDVDAVTVHNDSHCTWRTNPRSLLALLIRATTRGNRRNGAPSA